MNTLNYCSIRVCSDCYLTHHGYDEHELGHGFDREPWSLLDDADDVSSGWVDDDHDDEDSTDDDGFSWSPCEGCGSTLGGDRYRMTVWPA